jgi:hypothetical protein
MLQFLWFSSETNATWKNSYIFQKSYRIQHNIIILRISYFCKFPISQKQILHIKQALTVNVALSGGWHAPQLHYCESGCSVWAISETLLHWPWSYSAKVCALQCPETCFLPMAIRLKLWTIQVRGKSAENTVSIGKYSSQTCPSNSSLVRRGSETRHVEFRGRIRIHRSIRFCCWLAVPENRYHIATLLDQK